MGGALNRKEYSQKLEAAGHIASMVWKQGFSWGPSLWGGLTPVRVGPPTSNDLI